MLVVAMCPADRQHTVCFLLTIFIFKRFNEDDDFLRVHEHTYHSKGRNDFLFVECLCIISKEETTEHLLATNLDVHLFWLWPMEKVRKWNTRPFRYTTSNSRARQQWRWQTRNPLTAAPKTHEQKINARIPIQINNASLNSPLTLCRK